MHEKGSQLATCLLLLATITPPGRGGEEPVRPTTDLIRRLEQGQRQTVVVYGTSLTAGGAWVSQLSAQLDADYPGLITWSNGALSGRASNSGVANLEPRVLSYNPDAVFIEFATNDAFTQYDEGHIDFGITLPQARTNLLSMVDDLQGQFPAAQIVLQTMNPAWDAPNGNQSGSKRPQLEEYFEVYREVAAERGLLLIDNYAVWQTLRENTPAEFAARVSDGVHPDAAGYQRLVTPAIAYALGANTGAALLVDVETGHVTLANQSDEAVELIGYTISSLSGALLPGWEGLAGQGVDGWSKANPTPNNLSELNAVGSHQIEAGGLRDLGHGWNEGLSLDLAFGYQTADGSLHNGAVVYLTNTQKPHQLAGDYNDDGVVDAADYTVWSDAEGTSTVLANDAVGGVIGPDHYAQWSTNYGTAAASDLQAIPEPPPAALVLMMPAILASRRAVAA